jgi:hypothetical protein
MEHEFDPIADPFFSFRKNGEDGSKRRDLDLRRKRVECDGHIKRRKKLKTEEGAEMGVRDHPGDRGERGDTGYRVDPEDPEDLEDLEDPEDPEDLEDPEHLEELELREKAEKRECRQEPAERMERRGWVRRSESTRKGGKDRGGIEYNKLQDNGDSEHGGESEEHGEKRRMRIKKQRYRCGVNIEKKKEKELIGVLRTMEYPRVDDILDAGDNLTVGEFVLKYVQNNHLERRH